MLKQALSDVLNPQEIAKLSAGFDVIGDIAIIKIPQELSNRREIIAEQILIRMRNVRTILNQVSAVEGEFRTRKVEFVAGEEKFETVYKENGCLFKVNVESVYFSPRLSTERERVANLVEDGERILNMFAGIGTFSIIIAKKRRSTVDSVDKNPEAIRLARESLSLNRKLKGEVKPVLSDARSHASSNVLSFDRVLMPLPEKSFEFLDCAFAATKEGGTIHYYTHVSQDDFLDDSWIEKHLKKANLGRQYSMTNWKRVREVGPRYIQAVADLRVGS